ncbi:MAG: efflux RND transporter permease subunit [Sphingobacteriaceae bacterium]
MWKKLAQTILANRITLLVLVVASTAFMAWQASKVRLSFNAGKVLPLTDSAYIDYNSFKKTFGEDGSVMVVGIQSDSLFSPGLFNDWLHLSTEVKKIEGIKQVLSIGQLAVLEKDTLQQKFTAKPLAAGPVANQHQLDSLKQQLDQLPFYKDLIYNPHTKATVLAITFADSVLNSAKRIGVIQSILDKTQQLGSKHAVVLHYSGLPYIRTVISKKISEEFALFLGLSIGIGAIILYLFFRSFAAVFYPVVVVIVGVVWSLGTLVLFGYDITLLTGLIPPLIVVIGIPNSILLINKYHKCSALEADKTKALQRVITRVGITTFIANLTTAIGFGVLYFTNSELLMQFGSVASISVMVTWAISLIFIPIIFSFLPPPHTKHTSHLSSPKTAKLLAFLDRLAHQKRNLIYVATLLVLVVSFIGISHIKINGYVVDDLPKKDAVYKDMGFFAQNFKGILPLEISVDTRRKNGIMNLSVINKMNRLQDLISAHPEFSRAVSLVEVLKFSSQAFYGGDTTFYRLPNELEKNFILSYAANSGNGNSNLVKNFLDSNRQVTRLSFQMADVGSDKMNKLINEIEPQIDSIFNPKRYHVELTGSSIIFIKGTNYLVKNLRDSLLLAILLIAILMWGLFRGFRMILISLIPNIVPLIITAGIMGVAGIPLKPSTILIFSIAFGIASDQTIYFLTRYRQELRTTNWTISQIVSDTIKETGLSMIYVALILFFGFGIFTASTFGGTVALGLLLSITLLVALISNLTLLPALLLSLEKRKQKEKMKEGLVALEPEELS